MEMNKILSDLSQTKLFLQKTRNYEVNEETPAIKIRNQVTFEKKDPNRETLSAEQHSYQNKQSSYQRSSSLSRSPSIIVKFKIFSTVEIIN